MISRLHPHSVIWIPFPAASVFNPWPKSADAAFEAHAEEFLRFDGEPIGSSLNTFLQKPFTIIFTASQNTDAAGVAVKIWSENPLRGKVVAPRSTLDEVFFTSM